MTDRKREEAEETVILGADGAEDTFPSGLPERDSAGRFRTGAGRKSGEDAPQQYIPTPEEQAAQERAERAAYERSRYRQEQYDGYGGEGYGTDGYKDSGYGADYGAARYGAARYGAARYGAARYGADDYGAGGYGKPVRYRRGIVVGSLWVKILAALFIVTAVLAVVFFLLWRSSEQEATNPQPTVTVTTTRTSIRETTKTAIPGQGLLEDIFGRSDSSEPSSDTGAGGVTGDLGDGTGAGAGDVVGGAGGTGGDVGGTGAGTGLGDDITSLGEDLLNRLPF